MKSMINRTHIEGSLYQHDLELKVTGENSKNPGTEFISGNVEIATDNEGLNIVPVHFTYVTALTSKGKPNATYNVLKAIIDGTHGSVMKDGKDGAAKFRIDSAIGLNEWFTDRNGQEELVSVKRNEGGFVHVVADVNEDEKVRNTFELDMIITGTRMIEADPERDLPEKVGIKGAIFDFRKSLLPVEFTAENPHAMDYFEGLEASASNPVFTKLKGRQISETIVKKVVEEGAFGEPSVRETRSSTKKYLVTWAAGEPYIWDDESTITVDELKKAIADRETYLSTVKQRYDEYNASKNKTSTPAAGAFNF